MRAQILAKASLVLLLIPALYVSLGDLLVGLGFGINLWRADRPYAIALWLAVVLFPAFIVFALVTKGRPRRLWAMTAAAWAFAAFWLYYTAIWQPWGGAVWGW